MSESEREREREREGEFGLCERVWCVCVRECLE